MKKHMIFISQILMEKKSENVWKNHTILLKTYVATA